MTDHTWTRKSLRDRIAKIGLPIIISICICSLIISATLSVVLYKVYTDGHAQSLKQQKVIITGNGEVERLLGQVKVLQKTTNKLLNQHTDDLALLQKEQSALSDAEAKLSTAGTYIARFDQWVVGVISPLCQLIPGASSSPSCQTPAPVAPPGL